MAERQQQQVLANFLAADVVEDILIGEVHILDFGVVFNFKRSLTAINNPLDAGILKVHDVFS